MNSLAHFWHRSRRAWVPQTRDYLLTRMTDADLRMATAQGLIQASHHGDVWIYDVTPRGRHGFKPSPVRPKRVLTAKPTEMA